MSTQTAMFPEISTRYAPNAVAEYNQRATRSVCGMAPTANDSAEVARDRRRESGRTGVWEARPEKEMRNIFGVREPGERIWDWNHDCFLLF
jgi:hypothetical protein